MKLKHHYHNAKVVSVQYREDDIIVNFTLCGCCNPTPGACATLIFTGVRNLKEVREAFTEAIAQPCSECVGIVRENSDYFIDLSTAAIRIDARGLIEA